MSRTHFINFKRSTICQRSKKMKSHKKIAWKLEVMKTFQKRDCECWEVLFLISASHLIHSWASPQTLKLDKLDEQPKSCAGDEKLTKKWKIEHGFIWWDSHSGSSRNMSHTIMRSISWYSGENKFLQSMVKKCVSWNSMKEFFLKLMEKMLYVWETSEMFKFSYLGKFFSLNKLQWNGKYWKHELNPLFSWKSQVKLSLLGSSHSLQS